MDPNQTTPQGAPAPEPRKGLSTGAKVAIGCGIAAVAGILVVAVILTVGGLFLKDRAEDVMAGAERQARVSETLDRLRTEHPFEPPADGRIGEERAEMFFAVTDDAWDEMEEWADEMADISRRMEEVERPGLGDVAAGIRGLGRLGESREVLAESLADHDVSLGEYVWTGLALLRAHEARTAGEAGPEENLELAARYESELEALSAPGEGRAGRGAVLQMALVWGMGDPGLWRSLGLDTLYRTAP